MKVQEFIEKIKNDENFDIYKELEIKEYLPIQLKKTIAEAIIFESTDDSDGAVMINSFNRYMSYVKHMIINHTNLEYEDEDYDMLCETQIDGISVMNIIMSEFKDDASECSRVLGLLTDDISYENSVPFAIAKLIHNLDTDLYTITSNINNMIEKFSKDGIVPDGFDINEFNNILNNLNFKE